MRFSEGYWFIEGFDTAELKEAKALLEELNRQQTIDSPMTRGSKVR